MLEKSRITIVPIMNLYCTVAPPVAVAVNKTGLPYAVVSDGDNVNLTATSGALTVIYDVNEVTVALGFAPFISRAITVSGYERKLTGVQVKVLSLVKSRSSVVPDMNLY